ALRPQQVTLPVEVARPEGEELAHGPGVDLRRSSRLVPLDVVLDASDVGDRPGEEGEPYPGAVHRVHHTDVAQRLARVGVAAVEEPDDDRVDGALKADLVVHPAPERREEPEEPAGERRGDG